MGLLLSHKRTLTVYADYYSVGGSGNIECVERGERGDVQAFSAASRKRLFQLLHSVVFERATFVTLTYPAEFPEKSKKYKAQLKEFRRRFEREFGKVRAIWRLEFQKRGAPHYHIVYLDCPFIPAFQISGIWHKVIKSDDPNHLRNGVDIKLVVGKKEKRLIASYVAKYVAKIDKEKDKVKNESAGRRWGYWNIEKPTPLTIEISSTEASILYSSLSGGGRGAVSWTPVDDTRCTVFGNSLGGDDFGSSVYRAVLKMRSTGSKRSA